MTYRITNPIGFTGTSSYGGTALAFGPDGVAEVEELTPALARWLRAAGYAVEDLSEQPEAFDPADATVEEVLAYLDEAAAEERERVLAAEKAGQARKGILGKETKE